jgi:hypothetical protein
VPAKSEKQRKFLNWKFGHAWVKRHGFANKGKLPKRKGKAKRTKRGSRKGRKR